MLKKLFPKIKSTDRLFEKWYENTYSRDNFDDYMGFNEEDATETFDHDFCENDDLGLYNKDMKDKYPKIYNKKLELYKDSLLKEKARDWFEDRIYDFENDLTKTLEINDDGIVCYRAICIDDSDEFVFNLAHGVFLENYDGVGICWSWDKEKAQAHWGEGKNEVVLKGVIPFSAIDQGLTILLNLDPSLGHDEAEIRLFKGSKVHIIGIDDEKINHKLIINA